MSRTQPLHPQFKLTLLILIPLVAAAGLIYALLAAGYRTTPPGPSIDPVHAFNALWADTPADQRAAPVYERLHRAWTTLQPPDPNTASLAWSDVTPDHPQFAVLASATRTLHAELAEARAAADLPVLGADLIPPPQPAPGTEGTDPWLIDHHILGLPGASMAIQLLRADAWLAIEASDETRLLADLRAIAGITRQLRQCPIFIMGIVSLRGADACVELSLAAIARPGFPSDATLRTMDAVLKEVQGSAGLNLAFEAKSLEEIMDRTFSPGPNGRITAEGIERLSTRAWIDPGVIKALPDPDTLMAPIEARLTGTRQDYLDWIDEHLAMAEDARAAGPAAISRFLTVESERILNGATSLDMPLLHAYMPAFGGALSQEHLAKLRLAAARTALAVERSRLARGTLPDTLTDLVPDFLDAVPTDPWDLTGGPIGYRPTPAGFTIYYRGADLDDDAGTPPPPTSEPWYLRSFHPIASSIPDSNAPDADWVIYPPNQ